MKEEPDKQKPFHFKQFSLFHHQSTMKVGTDAVLLSAWADVNNAGSILDVGTGSGIIALMMAARSKASVDAVEIDPASCHEAEENFARSPFSNRLKLFRQDFVSYAFQTTTHYDLIISNPPFFINDMRSENLQKNNARHTDTLSYKDLCQGTARLLSSNSRFCVVLPYTESKVFIDIALQHNLFLAKKMLIFPKPCSQPNRVNLDFIKNAPDKTQEEKFIIRSENGNFTQQYVDLLSNYYTSIKP